MEILIPIGLAYVSKVLMTQKEARDAENIRNTLDPSALPNTPFRLEETQLEAERLAAEKYPEHLNFHFDLKQQDYTNPLIPGYTVNGMPQVPGHTMSSDEPVTIGDNSSGYSSYPQHKSVKVWNGHNNMVPFYGRRITQNTSDDAFQRKLESFTGRFGDTYHPKTETGPRFELEKQNVFGIHSQPEENRKERFIVSDLKTNERPVEQVRVVPIAETQTDFRVLPKNIDELRGKTNPKITFAGRAKGPKQGPSIRGETGLLVKKKPTKVWSTGNDYNIAQSNVHRSHIDNNTDYKTARKCKNGRAFEQSNEGTGITSHISKSYVPLKRKCKK